MLHILVSCKLIMESFSCDPCGSKYKTKIQLRKHNERIHDVRTYTCQHCNKILTGKHSLRNHIATHKETTCNKCGISIAKNSRSSHKMKCSFSEDIVFACDQCQYTTSIKGNMKLHRNTHLQENFD